VHDNDEQLRGVQDDGVQGSHARRQRCSVSHALALHVREQRKFSP
jgi:hypothetical protein